jgi:hypothetical protein
MIKGNLLGAAGMIDVLKKVAQKFPDRVAAALYLEAQIEVTEMKRRCPVDVTPPTPHPGNLRNSIHAELPERSGRMIWVTVATGMQAPYAIYVHEILENLHPVGQAKFMESVINESRPFMAGRIARRVKLMEKEA